VINLNQLRVFKAVFDEGSITAAARRLRISQPAVSKQLAELEESLGTTLVDRLPRGVRLTAAGELLQQHTRRVFQAETDAEAAMAAFLGLDKGRLAVGASTTIGSYLVPGVFGEFHEQHRGVTLELQIGNTQTILQAVREGLLDVGFTEGLESAEGLDTEVFAHDEIVLIVSPRHRLASVGRLECRQLDHAPLILRERGSGTREVVEAALAERGLQFEPAMSLGSSEAVKNAVARGLGLAFVSRLTVELELSTGRLKVLELTDLTLRRALHQMTLKGKHPSPAAQEFLRILHARR